MRLPGGSKTTELKLLVKKKSISRLEPRATGKRNLRDTAVQPDPCACWAACPTRLSRSSYRRLDVISLECLLLLPVLHEQTNFVSAMVHMKELTLNCTMNSRAIVELGITLIQHALSLHKLRIYFDLFFGKKYMRQLASMNIFRQLQELSLERTALSEDDLLAVLCRVPQLSVKQL